MVNDKVKTIIFGFVTVGNQSIYATVKGTMPITGGHHLQPGRPDGEERLLPERQPDDRDRRLRHVHEEALPEGEDRVASSIRLAGRRSRRRPRVRKGMQQVGVKVTMIGVPRARDRPDRAGDAGELGRT